MRQRGGQATKKGWTYKRKLTVLQAHELVDAAAAAGVYRIGAHGVIDCADRAGRTFSMRGRDEVYELKYTFDFEGLPVTINICGLEPRAARYWMEGKELEALD